MKIACLGWGSLIWKPDALALASAWFEDGPSVSIEFSRIGDGGELATALCMNAPPSQVLWAVLDAQSLDKACSMLREREQIPESRQDGVGVFPLSDSSVGLLAQWAAGRQLDAVIWTALPPRYEHIEGLIPSIDQVVAYLRGLSGQTLTHARQYIEQVPPQINTPYRREIIEKLGWDR